ncbi:fimbrial protein [Pseudomonas sp. CDFA 602]|uniref:fimbrial protein n=1 Tax=Pseudomonas californiensis TaxID=2829823 RepID=UPI001E3C262E|nr:fimbrial protein [Pseudomonas californiensis]MCD5993928.1 fimbrial protein [Pseudomonas californiensis]MCD5999569.1 fimbrial protein [Pseudomonas californiensis]
MTFPLASRWLQLTALLTMLAPSSAFALVCTPYDSGETAIHGDLGSTVAIPVSLPNGDIVWRSEPLSIEVECARDDQPSAQEEVFIHLNPDDLVIGQGIRAGLTLNGIDYLQDSGRISTGALLTPCLENDATVERCPTTRFSLAFSVFIQKFGATPPSGVASHLLDYRFFELGGAGLDRKPGRNLSYVINNLTGLRFVACDAELQVLPETVEFGDQAIQQAAVGKVFAARPFSLLTSRSCDSPFSINARFRPVTGSVSGDLLIPANNDSLGIRIVSMVNGKTLRYNEPFHLADLLGATHTARADFNAELLWNSSRPRTGPFNAEVMVDLFYK